MDGHTEILIVEDSKTDVFLICEALQSALLDAAIHIVYDGEQATRFIDAADASDSNPRPDVVLLDMNLPRKNGDDVLKHLRASRRSKNARVIIVSSSDAPRDRAAVANLGVARYFRKPFDFDEFMKLGGVVREVLQLSAGTA